MKKPEKKSLSLKTAEVLEEEIASGKWVDRLPGYRLLSAQMGVSPKIVSEALKILSRRKVLLPAVPRSPRLINPDRSQIIPADQSKNLTILTGSGVQKLGSQSYEIVLKIHERLQASGWQIHAVSPDGYTSGMITDELESLATHRRHHRWLMFAPASEIVTWAMEKKLEIICVGGRVTDDSPPAIGQSIQHKIGIAMEKVISLGHRRISLMTSRRKAKIFPRLGELVSGIFEAHQIPFQTNYNLPVPDEDTPEAFKTTLKKLLNHSPPTAIVVTASEFLPAIYSISPRMGLSIPDDLSLVTLQDDPVNSWFSPVPSHFGSNVNQIINPVCNWIENYPELPCAMRMVKPEFCSTESLASPPG